jgi:hypothetical protein
MGYSGAHHEPEDFRKLSEIKGLSKREFLGLSGHWSGSGTVTIKWRRGTDSLQSNLCG